MNRVFRTKGTKIERKVIEKHWDDTLGELDDSKIALLIANIEAMQEREGEINIQHIIEVWKQCGVQ